MAVPARTATRKAAPLNPPGTDNESAAQEQSEGELRKPTAEYIVALRQRLERRYAADHRELEDFRALVKGKKPVGIPEKYRRVDVDFRLRDMDEQINRLTSLIAGNFPKLKVDPLDKQTGDVQNATKRMTHTQPALEEAFRKAGGGNQYRAGVNAQLLDGAGIFKMVPVRHLWSDIDATKVADFEDDEGYPSKRGAKSKYEKYLAATDEGKQQAGVPVVITKEDVDSWYPLWEEKGITAHLFVQQRDTNATLKRYRMGIEADAKGKESVIGLGPGRSTKPVKMPDTITVIEYIDEEWYMVVVEHQGEGQIAVEFEHHYGRCPVFPMWGRNFVRGERRGESVVANMAGYLEGLNTFGTIGLNAGLISAVPPVFHEIPENADFYTGLDGTEGATRKPPSEEKWEPGTRIIGRPGEKLTALDLGKMSESSKEMVELLFKQMEKLGMPRAADAIAGDLEGAGFALNQILADLRAEKADILDEQIACLREMALFYWSLIRNPKGIGEVVYVSGIDPTDEQAQRKALIGLGPEDLQDQVHVDFEIDWSQDAAKLVLVRMVHERIERGTLDVDSGIRVLGDNPDQVNRGKIVDKIRQTEDYFDVAMEIVKQAVGRGDDNQAVKKAIAMMQAGQGGEQMPPSNPAQQAPGAAMGTPGVSPDMAELAAAKGQQAPGPSNGAVRGATAGVVVPEPPAGAQTV